MKKGFTLMELIVVIIILGILSTLGVAQYSKMVEKSRGAEAKSILGTIRQLAATYYIEQDKAPGSTDTAYLGIGGAGGIPANCTQSSHYFSYGVSNTAATTFVSTATRCTGNTGKSPGGSAGSVTLTSYLANGVDSWSSTGGY